jgi:hypothetical protein
MLETISMVSVIRNAIQNHLQLTFVAKDQPREICPHVLGTKKGVWHVLGWQFAGLSNTGPLPEWRCIELRDISTEIVAREGEWHRGWTTGQRGQSCVDIVDTMIDPEHAALIRNTSPARTLGRARAPVGRRR